MRWLRRCLDSLGERPSHMMALGWDPGATSSELFEQLRIHSLVTVDVERHFADSGALRSADGKATYVHVTDYRATEAADLAFTNGVFERLSVLERAAAAMLVFRSLQPGGLFAVWQNNPWALKTIFDVLPPSLRDEPPGLTPPAARRLLRGVGFDIVHTTSTFHFPRALTWCHPVEPLLGSIPLGAQYMILARKP